MRTMRCAEAEDAAQISHIYAASWKTAYRGLIADHYLDRLPDEYWLPSVRAWLGSGQMTGRIVEEDGKPVGACLYGRGRDEDHGQWGEIVSLYVLPEHMRTGCGALLLKAAVDDLRAEGYRRFYLWAIRGNETADSFYRKQGFHRTSDAVHYMIGGEPVADVRYVLIDS